MGWHIWGLYMGGHNRGERGGHIWGLYTESVVGGGYMRGTGRGVYVGVNGRGRYAACKGGGAERHVALCVAGRLVGWGGFRLHGMGGADRTGPPATRGRLPRLSHPGDRKCLRCTSGAALPARSPYRYGGGRGVALFPGPHPVRAGPRDRRSATEPRPPEPQEGLEALGRARGAAGPRDRRFP